MSFLDDIEEKSGLKVDNFTPAEKETLFAMLDVVSKSQLSPEKMKEYVSRMRAAVEEELVKEPTFIWVFVFKFENPKLIQLQARLKNYMLFEAFLSSPERAKQQLDNMIANVKSKA